MHCWCALAHPLPDAAPPGRACGGVDSSSPGYPHDAGPRKSVASGGRQPLPPPLPPPPPPPPPGLPLLPGPSVPPSVGSSVGSSVGCSVGSSVGCVHGSGPFETTIAIVDPGGTSAMEDWLSTPPP